MIPEVVKDTRSSWLRMHNRKSMWMAQGSQYVPKFYISAFWNNWKGVKNPHVLDVIFAGVVEDTGGLCLGFHSLYTLIIT